jgi:transcriptional regulator with XRE-family HTH domain
MGGKRTKSLTMIDQTIGARVRARRLELRMSQEGLGNKLGLTFQQVQRYESGRNRIGSSRLVEIANILQVDTSYFLSDLQGDGKLPTTALKFADFMATKDGVDINEAMLQLDRPHRKALIALARALINAHLDEV